ncbi:hypothetical protein [Yinghuangia sp. YIM S09857]
MGLVGGTVGLLGIGAVLVATRKVRASRNTTAGQGFSVARCAPRHRNPVG